MRFLPFSRYRIIGHSMEPTLRQGQVVWVFNWSYLFGSPKVGEVVVTSVDRQEIVKRVGRKQQGLYFLAGDNPNDSFDSRTFGTVEKEKILGKVLV